MRNLRLFWIFMKLGGSIAEELEKRWKNGESKSSSLKSNWTRPEGFCSKEDYFAIHAADASWNDGKHVVQFEVSRLAACWM